MEDYASIANQFEKLGREKGDMSLVDVATYIRAKNSGIVKQIVGALERMENDPTYTDAEVIGLGDYCYRQRSYYRG